MQQTVWSDSGMELLPAAQRQKKTERVHALERMQQKNAKFADIAVPLQARPLMYGSPENIPNGGGTLVAFEVRSSIKPLETLYVTQMESLGWHLLAVTRGAESVLFFDKPQRICSVSLRPVYKSKEQKTVIIIAWNDKKPGNQA